MQLKPQNPLLCTSRLLVAWLPFFRLERCGWSPFEAVALVHPQQGALRILALSTPAKREGVRLGMSATQARALLPELQLEHLDSLQREEEDLRELASQLQILAPHPQTLAPDTLCVEIHRTTALLGGDSSIKGEEACVEIALRKLRDLGHLSRITVVDGDRVGAAQAGKALAQWKNKHQVIPPQQLAHALADLPLKYIDLSFGLLESLQALGLRTAGAIAKLPAASLVHRYGKEALWLQQMARATPQPPRPTATETPQTRPCFSHRFELPANHLGQLMAVLEQGVEQISRILIQRDQATLRLHLQLALENGSEQHLHLHLGRAQRSPKVLVPLLAQRLERLQLQSGAESCQLTAQELCPYTGQQRNLLDRSQAKEDLGDLHARLRDSLGSEALLRPHLRNTHRPESEWGVTPPSNQERIPVQHRPTLILPIPSALSVHTNSGLTNNGLTNTGWPTALEIEGHWVDVRGAQGPERLCGEWWRPGAFDRDYWQLSLMDGRNPWIFCDRPTQSWWLHGWFD
jgi:protein ImuB